MISTLASHKWKVFSTSSQLLWENRTQVRNVLWVLNYQETHPLYIKRPTHIKQVLMQVYLKRNLRWKGIMFFKKKKKCFFFLLLGVTIVCLQNRSRFLQFVNSVPPLECQRLVYPMQRPYFSFMVTNDFSTLCFLGFQYRFWIPWGKKWKKKKRDNGKGTSEIWVKLYHITMSIFILILFFLKQVRWANVGMIKWVPVGDIVIWNTLNDAKLNCYNVILGN